MKALLYPFGPTEPSVQLTKDFPELDWTVVASPEDVARAAPGAAIYVTSNRTCHPGDRRGVAPPRQALRWMHFTSAGIDDGIAMGIPEGLIVTNSAGRAGRERLRACADAAARVDAAAAEPDGAASAPTTGSAPK